MSDVWTPADALAFRCSVEEVGCARLDILPASPAPQGTREDQHLARMLAPRALRALARLAEGEGRAAVEAAREILARAYGPPLPCPPEPAAPPKDAGALAPPSWLEEGKRLSYAAGVNDRGLN